MTAIFDRHNKTWLNWLFSPNFTILLRQSPVLSIFISKLYKINIQMSVAQLGPWFWEYAFWVRTYAVSKGVKPPLAVEPKGWLEVDTGVADFAQSHPFVILAQLSSVPVLRTQVECHQLSKNGAIFESCIKWQSLKIGKKMVNVSIGQLDFCMEI